VGAFGFIRSVVFRWGFVDYGGGVLGGLGVFCGLFGAGLGVFGGGFAVIGVEFVLVWVRCILRSWSRLVVRWLEFLFSECGRGFACF